tara:strand:+ start:200 stop:382 length:183 start_codon:yes stop_codon:yes gene_type:complete
MTNLENAINKIIYIITITYVVIGIENKLYFNSLKLGNDFSNLFNINIEKIVNIRKIVDSP